MEGYKRGTLLSTHLQSKYNKGKVVFAGTQQAKNANGKRFSDFNKGNCRENYLFYRGADVV
jgi:hypothetical protein